MRKTMIVGANAPGGAYPYVHNGRMIGGFAVIVYPARYGVYATRPS